MTFWLASNTWYSIVLKLDEKRISLINSGYHNPEYITYVNDRGVFLEYLRGEFSIIEGEEIDNGNYFPLNEEN